MSGSYIRIIKNLNTCRTNNPGINSNRLGIKRITTLGGGYKSVTCLNIVKVEGAKFRLVLINLVEECLSRAACTSNNCSGKCLIIFERWSDNKVINPSKPGGVGGWCGYRSEGYILKIDINSCAQSFESKYTVNKTR